MLDVHILTALWKRPEITKICFEGIKRLQSHPDYNIKVTAVISEESYEKMCRQYGIDYVSQHNKPVGYKWHTGLQKALESKFDYLMLLGSDDLISSSLLDIYKKYTNYYVFGVEDMYIYYNGSVKYFKGYDTVKMSIGAGRMIHRDVIEECGNKLWKFTRNRGLDGSALRRINAHGFDEHVINVKGKAAVLDIKSSVNLNRFEDFNGEKVDKKEVFKYFSDTETEMIRRL